jgi:ubiquitin-conjugating enzyme E2 O
MPNPPSADAADAFADQPAEWLGEVVDLGLDGLVTVRLGALDEPRDVRVPIERLHIIFNEDMDLEEGEFDDDEEYSDESDDEDGSSDEDDDDMEYVGMNEPQAIEEKIIYEGGERLDNGGEEDWLTDDDEDFVPNDSDEEMSDVEPAGMDEEMADEPVPRAPPAIPENVPAPEAIQLAPGAPSRFMVLDTEIPSDHAYKDQPATARTTAIARRIAKEHKILASSLPEGIFVRTWESRLDLLRVLIVGPLNTPYELAPFVFDFHFTNQFPTQPPVGFFHSWTSGVGRVNPNLYEDGKICLSLLGTWHAEKRGEGWSASGSSVLQLLVSLMGLVLVREPWYSMSPPNLCVFHDRVD